MGTRSARLSAASATERFHSSTPSVKLSSNARTDRAGSAPLHVADPAPGRRRSPRANRVPARSRPLRSGCLPIGFAARLCRRRARPPGRAVRPRPPAHPASVPSRRPRPDGSSVSGSPHATAIARCLACSSGSSTISARASVHLAALRRWRLGVDAARQQWVREGSRWPSMRTIPLSSASRAARTSLVVVAGGAAATNSTVVPQQRAPARRASGRRVEAAYPRYAPARSRASGSAGGRGCTRRQWLWPAPAHRRYGEDFPDPDHGRSA